MVPPGMPVSALTLLGRDRNSHVKERTFQFPMRSEVKIYWLREEPIRAHIQR